MSLTAAGAAPAANRGGKDIAFAVGIVLILCLFFLPVPAFMIDFGLALSIALAVLILMVALWIHKPLEFSAFPTVLLVATILRLALNISTTRLILSRGEQGPTSAGYIIGGFAQLVMGGDFVIGIIVFLILVTINFLVITKGATRIAEVGARFTLDAIPGKQMAIDADLSAGLIDEKVAQARRRELEEESAFFGSMDGASKFVRGDAIAGLIILAVNIFGGIVIGVTRHSLSLAAASDIFTKLSVGDGLVTQIPALIISLAAGLLVAKGGTRGSADKAIIDQLSGYPNALFLAAMTMGVLGVVPGLPFLPFALLGGLMAFVGVAIPRRIEKDRVAEAAKATAKDERARPRRGPRSRSSSSRSRSSWCLSKELNAALLPRATRSARASPKCGASSPASTALSFRRSASPTTSKRRRRPTRSRFTAPPSRPRSSGSRTASSSSATGPAPISPATKSASRRSACARLRSPKPSSRTPSASASSLSIRFRSCSPI